MQQLLSVEAAQATDMVHVLCLTAGRTVDETRVYIRGFSKPVLDSRQVLSTVCVQLAYRVGDNDETRVYSLKA